LNPPDQFDPAICNLLELFDHRPRTVGHREDRITPCFPHLTPIAGYEVTATFRATALPVKMSLLSCRSLFDGLTISMAATSVRPRPVS